MNTTTPVKYRLKTAYRDVRLVLVVGALSPIVMISLAFNYLARIFRGGHSVMA